MAAMVRLAAADIEAAHDAAVKRAKERERSAAQQEEERLLEATWRLFPSEASGMYKPEHVRAVFGMSRLPV